jgi:hypothetical protein
VCNTLALHDALPICPYVLDWFRSQLSSDFPWVFSYGQMPQSQAIACQQLLGSSEQTAELEGKDFV